MWNGQNSESRILRYQRKIGFCVSVTEIYKQNIKVIRKYLFDPGHVSEDAFSLLCEMDRVKVHFVFGVTKGWFCAKQRQCQQKNHIR